MTLLKRQGATVANKHMHIKDNFNINISEENEWVIPLIAKEFGYIEGSEISPEDTIKNFLKDRRKEVRNRIALAIDRYFGEAGQDKAKLLLALYDKEAKTETSIDKPPKKKK